jgi:autotransporter-associated beta strand protein
MLAAGGAIDTGGFNVSLPGFITGPGRLAKTGSGTLTLTNSNSYGGGTLINSGTLSIGADYTLGSGGLMFDGGTLQTTGNFALQRNVTLLPAGGAIDTSGFDVSLPGFITGSGALRKTGDGILTLSNSNSYSGGTTIDGGTLNFATTAALPTTGNIIVNPGGKLFLGQQGNLFTYGTPSQSVTLDEGTLEFGNMQGPFTLSDWLGNVALVGTSTISSIGGPVVLGQITGSISGSGQLRVNGTIKLANANTFTGDTRIVGGGLVLGHSDALLNSTLHLFASDTGGFSFDMLSLARFGGLTGSRNLSLQNDNAAPVALFVGYNGASNHYNGVLSGSGQLIKTGPGTQTLNGANTYTGDTRIEDGVLALGNSNAIATSTLHMLATDNGTLSFGSLTSATLGGLAGTRNVVLQNESSNPVYLRIGNNNASNNYNGRLRGTGALAKIGTGIQILNGNNDYTGGTTIFSGALEGNTTSLQGAIAIAGSAQLIFQQPANGTFVGNIEGAGSVVKNGAGTLSLFGNHLYTGGTTINGGAIAVDAVGSSIMGPVAVNPGATLTGHGSIAGNVSIAQDGSLRGKLTIQGNVTSSGTVAPGFSPEIINVSGDYTQTPDGVLEIEIGGPTPGTQHDQLNVSGTASLAGRLEVPFIDAYMGSTSHQIIFLSAAQIAGTFDEVAFENVEILAPNLHPLVIQSRTDLRVIFLGTEPLEDYLLRGDMNNDGHVNQLDVPLFAKALLNPAAYDAAHPQLGLDYRPIVGNADTNGVMDFDDIDDFVALLEPGPGASLAAVLAAINAELQVPEPPSVLFIACGSYLLAGGRVCRRHDLAGRPIAIQVYYSVS